ncbi:MAG: DUF3857 domain-containing protein, partial [Bacteroidota bacterium]
VVKFKNTFDSEAFIAAVDFLDSARKQNMSELRSDLDNLMKHTDNNSQLIISFAPIYDQLFQDKDKTIEILEGVVYKNIDYEAINMLARYYDQQNRKKDVIALLSKDYEALTNDNYYIRTLVRNLHDYQMYEESLPYIDQTLKNFPYSFLSMELKGDALKQLKKEDEALDYYNQSLAHKSNRSNLRTKITDLQGNVNALTKLAKEDAYDYIKSQRGIIKSNNYGFNILLDDNNIEIYEEGGVRFRYVFIYEVTSNAGIDVFKEYNLGLTGDYDIIKSELVKPDGRIVPADRSGSSLVFNDISVGDVVYIDYEGGSKSSGRFYKDFSDTFQFESFHPMVESSLEVIVPKGRKIHYQYMNGKIDPVITKGEDNDIYKWELNGSDPVPYAEDYMPNYEDILGYLHVSTINDWNEISQWYSDLVRARIEVNATVRDTFKELFPDGHEGLSQDQRAKIIYDYIRENFNYSYVSFRQSGYVPQKPSKTITTALGDCKDFSTLFVTLANMAELESNLVLILTSDYGQNNMVLPSTQFNHCIVKVNIEGTPQFLELTSKYLPYKSLPMSLRNATALEVPYNYNDSDSEYDLFKLNDVARDMSKLKYDVSVDVSEESMILDILSQVSGHSVSYYAEVFSEPNKEVVKKYILEDYESRIASDFILNSVGDVNKSDDDKMITYNSNLTISKKLNKIGSINIFQLPKIAHPYESSVIQLEERNYPIEYIQYEGVDHYEIAYDLVIDEGKSFVEIPESKSFTFKEHSYEIAYELKAKNKLSITITAKPSFDNISPKDYLEYKAFVKAIVEAQNEFIGFK